MSEPFGRYELLKRLAGGGMGEVFLARQPGIEGFEKLLVIKTLLPHLGQDPDFVAMFLDEARLAARLAHPNCIQIYDLGQEQGVYFIAMEHVYGEDLKRLWKQAYQRQALIPVAIAARIVADAAAGLGYAHRLADAQGASLGLVHRDVSPQNILITFDGGVKLIDFGVAKARGRSTRTETGALKGKYAYMSPEQIDGMELDQRSDIFSLGIVLWETVTGSRLFREGTDVATLKAVSRCEVPVPSEQNPAVPPELDPILLKALARDRDERYATMEDLRLDLENWIARSRSEGSQAHLAAFMRGLFSDRLEHERARGPLTDVDPDATGFSPLVNAPPTRTKSGTSRNSLAGRGDEESGSLVRARPQRSNLVVGGIAAGAVVLGGAAAVLLVHAREPAPAPVVATAPAPPANVPVAISSEPSGAEVRVDGVPSGTTPVQLTLALDKQARVELVHAGYHTLVQPLLPTPGMKPLTFTLEALPPPPATVRLESDPPGAEVFAGDKRLGTTPADWQTVEATQPVALTFRLRGYEDAAVRVTPGRDSSAHPKLARAHVEHHDAPAGAGGSPALDIKMGR